MTARPICADLDTINPCAGQTATWPVVGGSTPRLPDTGPTGPLTAAASLMLTAGAVCLLARRFHVRVR